MSLGVSSLLLSIEWFTWQAWIFVSVYMVIQYWYQMCRSSDMLNMNNDIKDNLNGIHKSVIRFNESVENFNKNLADTIGRTDAKLEKIRKILIHESK